MQRFCIRRDVCTLAYPSLHYLGTFPELIRLGGFRVIAVCRQSRSSTQWHTLLHSKRHLLDTSSLPAFRPGAPKGPVDWRSATAVSIPSTRACSSFKKHSSSKLWRPWCCKRWTRHSRRLAACHEWKGQTDYYARALSGTWTDTSSHRSASQSPREDYHVNSETSSLDSPCTLLSRLLLSRTSCRRPRLCSTVGCRIQSIFSSIAWDIILL